MLLGTVIAHFFTPGYVEDLFPRILGELVSVPSYAITFFVIGVLEVVGPIYSMRDDLIDDILVRSIFLGV